MKSYRKHITRVLVFLLLAGPVQAQQVFQCSMMDSTFYDNCCCDDHGNCADSNCDQATDLNNTACCDTSVELNLDNDAVDISKAIKSLEIRSGIDPPAKVLPVHGVLLASSNTLLILAILQRQSHLAGTDTYLITQRLRI